MDIKPSVLFIDSNKSGLIGILSSLGISDSFSLFFAENKKELQDIVLRKFIDIAFVDVTFITTETGLQILQHLNSTDNNLLLTIAVTPENNGDLLAKVIDLNPFFYISKPYDAVEIKIVLKRALEKAIHLNEMRKKIEKNNVFCGIIGRTPRMKMLFELISKIAADDFSNVLILGESGTGKELVAKAIHSQSKRKSGNFVPVNCAAIPDELLESELFGHTKGAFTGATHNKKGRIQYADGGTLFLDEIGDMKTALQAKLLRVIQEKEFEPVGGLQSTPVDTRILAATHCDLELLVKEGKFREDLYYRLSVIPLHIPPLKERREDIPLLIESFIESYTQKSGREKFAFSEEALSTLMRYNWRGNVRELENLIQHMSILYCGKIVSRNDLPEKFLLQENVWKSEETQNLANSQHIVATTSFSPDIFSTEEDDFLESEVDFNNLISDFETRLILSALRSTGGNKKEAARLLNLKRTTLLEKIKKKKLNADLW